MVNIADRIGVVLVDTAGVPYKAATSSGGGASQVDDSPYTVGDAGSSFAPVGGIVTADSVDSGDGGAFAMLANRQQKITLYSAAGAEITGWPVTNTGTFVVQENGAALTALQLMDDWDNAASDGASVSGDTAHDDVDAGEPVKIGGKASSSAPTNVTAGDRVNQWFGLSGAPVMGAFGSAGADGESNTAGFLIGSDGNVRALPVQTRMFNGSTWDRIRGDTTNGLLVNLGTNNDVTVTSGTITLGAGTAAYGKLAANSGVDIGDVDVTSIAAGTNLIGDVGIQPRTSGGLTTFMASGSDGSSILVATKQTIKNSAGQLYGWYVYNPEAAVSFVHFYNTDTVTVGTTNPQITLAVPAGAAANMIFPVGIVFSTAISCAATTTAGGNTAPATGVSLVALYK